VNWDIRRPQDFDTIARFAKDSDVRESVLISADLGQHRAWLAQYAEMGFAEIHLHQVGRRQLSFIEAFGQQVLPSLKETT
jgi:hypothetical protein